MQSQNKYRGRVQQRNSPVTTAFRFLNPTALQLKLAIIIAATVVSLWRPQNSTAIALISMLSNCGVEIVDFYYERRRTIAQK
jgi:hypothetical protein